RKLGVTVAPIEPRGAEAQADERQQSADQTTTRLSAGPAEIQLTAAKTPRTRGALCLLTDITEVAELREAVALKRNLESLGEMSAGLAHEFKNALATLHGYAQLLERVAADERTRAAAAALLQEVRGLTQLVTSFLNFARPRALELSEVSLGVLIDDCAAELKSLYDERGVKLAIGGDFGAASADETMLRQSLLNLLRNAAEAFGEPGPQRGDDGSPPAQSSPRRVTLRGSRERDAAGKVWHVVEIEDTAGGIAAEDLARIFIPFFTTKHGGHGVGLALAHRVTTEHGGTLTAANAPGGAIFTLRLPA
ncbi:MAG TPA: ATP-binding protein, partial [Pyrinomonadaceae bacterium]